ncbi:MAG: YciI family protein [Microthrixaceae bacterium]
MPQYLLSVCMIEGEPPYPTEEKMQQAFKDVDVFNAKLQADGSWVFAGGLHPASVATVVDGTGPEVLFTDGPFAEVKEHIGGFWIIDVPDLDAALQLAAEGSKACQGRVEVRPFQEEPEA